MKKFLSFIICTFLFLSCKSFHIVGGEMSFETIKPGVYKITLIQYYDEAQTINNTYDGAASVYIFSNKDNSNKGIITLPFRRVSNVNYTNIKCVIDQLKTSRVEYSAEFSLDPIAFADPEGYYITWERCCRNQGIKNLVNPSGAGMNYVVEIPPLYKDGIPLVNSSPTLFRPLSDYACVGQLYYVNFIGIDPDGDSLSYQMATPLNSSAIFPAAPTPQPKPLIPVRFVNGYSKDNAIHGSPPLNINSAGFLTVNPSETGLYVFSVLVTEWRNGKKLGSVQRDFQMLVVDGCEPPDPPVVGVKIPGNPDFNPEVDILNYAVADEKCFEYLVTNISAGEEIFLKAELAGSAEEIEDVFEITSTFIDEGQDTLLVKVCAPDCPPVRGKPFEIDLIASDDACPLPQLDTVRLTLNIEPPPNEFPVITPGDNSFFINESDFFSLDITGTDADNDTMDMYLVVDGIEDPESFGFTLDINSTAAGQIEGTLNWDTDCLLYNFDEDQQYNVRVFIDDRDSCMVPNPDHLFLSMNVILPPNTKPVLSTSGFLEYNVTPDELVEFDVNLVDSDGDSVLLRMVTTDFDSESLGVSFPDIEGIENVTSAFSWDIDCMSSFQTGKDQFEFLFLGEDSDFCKIKNEDTLRVIINVEYQDNQPPEFASYGNYRIRINETFTLDIEAFDADTGDSVSLGFYDDAFRPNSPGLSFPDSKGKGAVSSTLTWTPECDLLDLGEVTALFDLVFEIKDNGCPVSASDTMKISFELYDDRISFEEFLPPNVFSPNGDGYNDKFSLSDLIDPSNNLPGDNCLNTFEYVSIFDRNGKAVFKTEQRDFSWTGDDVPSGVYYYVIKYSRKEYKGHLQLLR
ncbi:MAG: gliding motility-associated C-terminal domain-containing protein [Bacteroidota bacterium]